MSENGYYDSIRSQAQLDELPTFVILGIYNKCTGKSTTKFASRAKGLEQTWKAMEASRIERGLNPNGTAKKAAPDGGEEKAKPAKRTRSRIPFRLAPAAEQKKLREGTKRETIFKLLSREKGATVAECQNHPDVQWDDRTVYEGIRLLNTYCGFGLFAEVEGDTYRVRIVDQATFDRLSAEVEDAD